MVIIIGASGFIGTYLSQALVKVGVQVVATGRSNGVRDFFEKMGVQYITLDISNKEDFEKLPKQGVEAVVLLAALLPANVTDYDPYQYVDVNIKGTLNALEYCRVNGIKKIISTTSYADVQLIWKKNKPIDADVAREYKYSGDHAAYVFSKNTAADFILHYNEEYGMQGSIFRLPPVYGVGPHSSIYVDGKLYKSGIQVFIEKAVAGEPIEIFGDKDVSRDVVSVKDVVSAFIGAINSDKSKGMYNIMSGVSTSLYQQVVDIIDVFCDKDKPSEIILSPQKKNNSTSYAFDISKATRDFGYRPQFVSFKELIRDYKRDMELNGVKHLTNLRKKK